MIVVGVEVVVVRLSVESRRVDRGAGESNGSAGIHGSVGVDLDFQIVVVVESERQRIIALLAERGVKNTLCCCEGFCLFGSAGAARRPQTIAVYGGVVDTDSEVVGGVLDGNVTCVGEFAVVGDSGCGGGEGGKRQKKRTHANGKRKAKEDLVPEKTIPAQGHESCFLFELPTTVYHKTTKNARCPCAQRSPTTM